MFTGLVEEKGKVSKLESLGDSVRLEVNADIVLGDVGIGDSISVNGVCLTVVSFDDDSFAADVMQESLNRSSLGELEVGGEVNLERAVAAGQRLGGHLMQGHVDTTTTLLQRTSSEHWDVLRFGLPAEWDRYVVEKGSIAVDGVSLTVSAVGEGFFEVSLIPETLRATTLGQKEVGDLTNLEVDIVGKYVEKMLAHQSSTNDGVR